MSVEGKGTAAPGRIVPFAVAGTALLAVASGALFYYATISRKADPAQEVIKVEVGAKACNPNDLTVPAGRRTFEIHNASDRPVEWEILDGIMVLEERENIVPGFRQTLTANLKPGAYEITCGLLSNPRGKLTVTATAASDAAAQAGPDLKAFIGPLSEYKVFLVMQGSALESATRKLVDAVKAGDLETARAAYGAARLPYRQVAAVVGRWSDLANAVDPVAAYLEKREQDPAFTGFHRIEYGLFGQNSTEGLGPVADKLLADVGELKTRLRALKPVPEDLPEGAAKLARLLADGKIESGESAYAQSDLPELDASLAAIGKMAGLVKPLIPAGSENLAGDLDGRLAAVRQALDAFRKDGAWPAYDKVDAAQRKALADGFRALADTLDKVSQRLSVE